MACAYGRRRIGELEPSMPSARNCKKQLVQSGRELKTTRELLRYNSATTLAHVELRRSKVVCL